MNELMKPVIVLTAICVVAAALLGFTYNITAPLIAQAEEDATNAAMAEVVPGATSFTPCELSTPIEGVLAVSQADGGLGYAIQVQDQGYGGAYVVMVGIGPDGMPKEAKEFLNKPFATSIQRTEQIADFLCAYQNNEKQINLSQMHDDRLEALYKLPDCTMTLTPEAWAVLDAWDDELIGRGDVGGEWEAAENAGQRG